MCVCVWYWVYNVWLYVLEPTCINHLLWCNPPVAGHMKPRRSMLNTSIWPLSFSLSLSLSVSLSLCLSVSASSLSQPFVCESPVVWITVTCQFRLSLELSHLTLWALMHCSCCYLLLMIIKSIAVHVYVLVWLEECVAHMTFKETHCR